LLLKEGKFFFFFFFLSSFSSSSSSKLYYDLEGNPHMGNKKKVHLG